MTNIRRTTFPSLAVALILIATPFYSRCLAQQPQQAEGQPAAQNGDPIRELNLSPEQREKIRTIREEMKEERAGINRKLRETNEALDEALDTANPDDAVVEQRLHDVAAAQGAALRMRVLTEVRVRRVLTPDQLSTLRSLRQSARLARRERQLETNNNRPNDAGQRRAMRNQQNGLAPLFPRRNALPKSRP